MFYSFYAAAVVSIISRNGLSIDKHCENQPNNYKLALYKPSIHFNNSIKWLYISSKMKWFSNKGGCGVMLIKTFKVELALATYKRLRVTSNITLFKTVMPVRN